LVDKTEDPDSLMWKLDFIHRHLPRWMMPRMAAGDRTSLHFRNPENGSTIDGSSTTGDVGRGGRRTAILLDEFASVPAPDQDKVLAATRDNTPCRLMNSTPKGSVNAFHKKAHDGKTRKLRLHWPLHPVKAVGLYRDAAGKQRSPWYDAQCERAGSLLEIAQELDIDYLGSGCQWFDAPTLDRVEVEHCRPPYHIGELHFAGEADVGRCPVEDLKLGFESVVDGNLHLWVNLDSEGRPPADRDYVVSADICAGTGSSNSVLVVGDRKTGEKVAEWAHSQKMPHECAPLAVALARWFAGPGGGGAFLIWEANGAGRIFGKTVLLTGYRNFFYKQDEKSIGGKQSDVPGWWSSPESKVALLGEYRRAISKALFVERSRLAIGECREYIYLPDGGPAHARSVSSVDPSGARENHGDRVIASALCWRGIQEFQTVTAAPATPPVPPSSFKARQDAARRAEKAKATW